MNINDFPNEILAQILQEVTKANVRDGPTYTFGLQQAPLPLERAKLQRYVRGPVPPELLKWDATATLRSVCWKWHDWALEHSIKDVYIRRWKGGERWAELSNRRESYPLYELIDRPTGTAVYRDPFASLKRTVAICNDYPQVASKIRRMWVHGFYTAETDRLVFDSLKNCCNLTSLSIPWTTIRHVDAKTWRTMLTGSGKPLQSLELQCVDPTSQQAADKDNLVDLEPLQSVNFSQLRRLKIFGDTSFMPITDNDLSAIARTATQLEEFHLTCNSSITIDGVMAIVKASRKTLRVLEHSPRSQDGFWHPHPGSPSDCEHLREYKYSGVDHSLLSQYVLKPFYNHVVIKCFPMWMAPNLITLSGFGFVVANFLTLLWYTPTLDQDCPPWVYASWAIGLFLYQTFDAVDGSQARRTRQSGPLGELFDHGVDAINTTLEVLLFSATMNLGQGWKTVLTLFASSLTFYVQTWDEYHTHTLTLGVISGPVEGIITLCIVYALTAYLGGGSFWQRSMIQSLGIKEGLIPEIFYNMAWNEWYMVYGGVVLVFNTVSSALNVMKARRARGEKTRVALLGLLTFGSAWVLIVAYLYLQPMILHHHLVPFIFYAGLINAYSVGRMIISHLTKSRFPRGNVLMYPLIYGVIDSLGPWLQEHIGVGWPSALGNDVYQVAFVFMCLGLAVGVHGSFIVDVIWTICDYLDIWCLTIKYPYQPVEENMERKEQ